MKHQLILNTPMSNVKFKEITASVASGNHQAFRMFYDYYYLKVYRFVRYYLYDPNDCEMVVSDIFCLVWEKRGLLENVENMEAYLYQICRHESFHYLKKKKSEELVSIDEMSMDLPSFSDSIEDEITESEMMQVYQLAVNKLPKRCKTVFQMVREQKLSHKEVSEIMGITPGTIEVQMNLAIKKITSVVKTHYPKLMNQRR